MREAKIDLADEIDNHIDIHANTTMQISSSSADNATLQQTESFLVEFAETYLLLKADETLVNLPDQIAFVKQTISEKLSDIDEELLTEDSLKFWLSRMVSADQKVLNQDYIIDETGKVRIVHHQTTGRVDCESIWSDGSISALLH